MRQPERATNLEIGRRLWLSVQWLSNCCKFLLATFERGQNDGLSGVDRGRGGVIRPRTRGFLPSTAGACEEVRPGDRRQNLRECAKSLEE